MRLTPEEFRELEVYAKPKKHRMNKHTLLLQKAVAEIRALGGPVCVECNENQARYTTDCCALCDAGRGERL